MNTEPVLRAMVAKVTEILKQAVNQVVAQSERPTLYDLEEQTQAVLAPIGQALLQGLVNAEARRGGRGRAALPLWSGARLPRPGPPALGPDEGGGHPPEAARVRSLCELPGEQLSTG